jgi:hypothetical protein
MMGPKITPINFHNQETSIAADVAQDMLGDSRRKRREAALGPRRGPLTMTGQSNCRAVAAAATDQQVTGIGIGCLSVA